MSANPRVIVHRIRELIEMQMRTTTSALQAPLLSSTWRDYAARERKLRELFDKLEDPGRILNWELPRGPE